MNAPQDLDRQLAAMLEDGPTRAPESAIEGALAHARSHPRRPDPFAFLRRDPMGAASSSRGRGFGALPVVAILGLLLVGALAAASIGGWLQDRNTVVPPPAPTASAAPSVTPSTSPSPSVEPSATPSATPTSIHVNLIQHVGADTSIDIVDRSGTLVSAESGDPGDGGSVAEGTIQVVADASDPKTLVATWTGSPCDTTHALDIAPDGTTWTITRPACSGDSVPADHVLRLTFDAPFDPASITGTVLTSGN
jgi:hypothetical protein